MAAEIFGYARVSSRDQNLGRQSAELRTYVPKNDNIITDKKSGKDFERPGYEKLKAALRSGDELYIKSLDRLGRNKKQLKDEMAWFQSHGILLHIIDFPQTMIEPSNPAQKEMLELTTNIMVEILTYMAEMERRNIKQRQAEGIEAWKKTGITKTGRPYGRPKKDPPKNWEKVYNLWYRKEIKTKEAIAMLGIGRNSFYRLVHKAEGVE